MSSIESSKNLAGIGALLVALTVIPGLGIILGIIGLILLFIGVKGLADSYQDKKIYDYSVSGVVYLIMGILVTGVIITLAVFGIIATFGLGFFIGIGIIFLALLIGFVFYLMAAMQFRKAFSLLSQKSGEHLFETAGLILFIGAVLTIILVGLALMVVAWILAAIAFFSMKSSPQATQSNTYIPPSPTQSTTSQTVRYCSNCGAPNEQTATFCKNCGKPLT
jgi:uncharacterized membrane protein